MSEWLCLCDLTEAFVRFENVLQKGVVYGRP
jgi:hypothetical protein